MSSASGCIWTGSGALKVWPCTIGREGGAMIENGASNESGAGTGGEADLHADPYAAVLRPVRSGNTFEETVEKVLQLIRLGLVPVGDRLPPERELADRLQISRVTL